MLTPLQDLTSTTAGEQLTRDLRQYCLESDAHQAILPERKLAARYQISHGTVRRVLDDLLDDGLIYKVHGKGSFVAEMPAVKVDQRTTTIIYADSWGGVGHPHYARRLEGLMAEASAQAIRLEIVECGQRLEERERLLAELRRPQIAGLIAPWMTDELMQQVRKANLRTQVVLTASMTPPIGASAVGIDYAGMGHRAMTYCLRKGVTRPLFVADHAETALAVRQHPQCGTLACLVLKGEIVSDANRILAAIEEHRPDALVFDDDMRAKAVLAITGRPEMLVLAHHNAGDKEMPPWVVRLQVDGRVVGRWLIRTLRAMIDDPGCQNTLVRIAPSLIEPQ